jgi:hypothetical protein
MPSLEVGARTSGEQPVYQAPAELTPAAKPRVKRERAKKGETPKKTEGAKRVKAEAPTPEPAAGEKMMTAKEMQDAVREGVKEAMREARPLLREVEPLVQRAEVLQVQVAAPEVAEATAKVARAKQSFFAKYHAMFGFMAALGVGAFGGPGITDVHQKPETQQESQMERIHVVMPDILRALHTALPSDQAGFDALIARHLTARVNQHGDRGGEKHAKDLLVVKNEIAETLRTSAAQGDFAFAARVLPFVGEQTGLTYIELCTLGHQPQAAIQHFTDIVHANQNPTARHRALADTLDDMAEVRGESAASDPYVSFMRTIVAQMQQTEGASTVGRQAMHALGAELEAGLHQQERDAYAWQRREESDEHPVDHLESIKDELERIHQAEAILGTNPVISLSRINADIARAEAEEEENP